MKTQHRQINNKKKKKTTEQNKVLFGLKKNGSSILKKKVYVKIFIHVYPFTHSFRNTC